MGLQELSLTVSGTILIRKERLFGLRSETDLKRQPSKNFLVIKE